MAEIENKVIPLKIGEKEKITVEINAIFEYEAPVEQGRRVGTLTIKYDDKIIETIEICNKYTIEKKDILSYMLQFFEVIGKQRY